MKIRSQKTDAIMQLGCPRFQVVVSTKYRLEKMDTQNTVSLKETNLQSNKLTLTVIDSQSSTG